MLVVVIMGDGSFQNDTWLFILVDTALDWYRSRELPSSSELETLGKSTVSIMCKPELYVQTMIDTAWYSRYVPVVYLRYIFRVDADSR
jgi:hypothetical protein